MARARAQKGRHAHQNARSRWNIRRTDRCQAWESSRLRRAEGVKARRITMRNRGMIRDLTESIQSIFCLYNQLNASVTLISPWYPYDASIFPVAYSKFHLLQSGTSSHFRLLDPHWPPSLKLVDHSTVPMVNFLTTHQGQVRNISFADHCQSTAVSQILLHSL